MRNFNNVKQDEKVWLKLHITAKQAAALQKEAKKMGLTMSGYMAVKLQEMVDAQEVDNLKQEV